VQRQEAYEKNPRRWEPHLSLRKFQGALVPAVLEKLNQSFFVRCGSSYFSNESTDHSNPLATTLRDGEIKDDSKVTNLPLYETQGAVREYASSQRDLWKDQPKFLSTLLQFAELGREEVGWHAACPAANFTFSRG